MTNTKNSEKLNLRDTVTHDYTSEYDEDPMELVATDDDEAFLSSDDEPVGGIEIDYENPNLELQLALKNNDVVRHEHEHLLFLAIADDVEYDHQMEIASLQKKKSHASKIAKKGNEKATRVKKKITKKIKNLDRRQKRSAATSTITLRNRQTKLKEFVVLTQLDNLPSPKKAIGHVAVAVE